MHMIRSVCCKEFLPRFSLFCCLLSCLIAYGLRIEPALSDSTLGETSYFTVKNSGLEVPILDEFVLVESKNREVMGIFRLPDAILPEINIVRIPKIKRALSADSWAKRVKDDYANVGITSVVIINSASKNVSGASFPVTEILYERSQMRYQSYVAYVSTPSEGFVITFKDTEDSFNQNRAKFDSVLSGIKFPNSPTQQKCETTYLVWIGVSIIIVLSGYLFFKRSTLKPQNGSAHE